MENGMLVELRGRSGRRDRLLFACQATVSTFVILMTTVSCSKRDMPQPPAGIFGSWFSGSVTDSVNTQLVEPDEEQPRVQRERPKTSGSRKVAVMHAPKQTGKSVSRHAAKKASTPPRLDAQKEEQLFQEFLEWRMRQKHLP
jgi:hypothetical protein